MKESEWLRNIALYEFLDETDKSVMGLGSETIYFRVLFSPKMNYYVADYRKHSFETIVCDFNKGEFPELYTDIIICSEIIKRIDDPIWLLKQITLHCRKVLLCYHEEESNVNLKFNSIDIIKYMSSRGFCITKQNKEFEQNGDLLVCFEKMTPKLVSQNINCTGCGACANICPDCVITMEYDENGYLKPYNHNLICRNCGKCLEVCPTIRLNDRRDSEVQCYAAWASDDIRLTSSSGGVFSVIAEYIIKKGGYVFGAVWTEDFYCKHIGIKEKSQISSLKYSKYTQSNTQDTFRKVKSLLKQNILVAYFGTPCQIAGLNSYLGDKKKEYTLILVDLVCFGTPSNKHLHKYLEENYGLQNLKKITFRDKTQELWSHAGFKVELKNGKICFPDYNHDRYQKAFHSGLLRNSVCENCKFTDFPRQGDLTLGDFWGIEQHDLSWNDGKGTSLIITNTLKGDNFLREIESDFQRIELVPLKWALNKGNRLLDNGRSGHLRKEYYEHLIKTRSFNQSVDWTLKNKHDIGVVCVINRNFGNNLTNFALYQYLTDQKYEVLVINRPLSISYEKGVGNFLKSPYPPYSIAKRYEEKDHMKELNDLVDIFILGSDQLLRSNFIEDTQYYTCLDWVASTKYKITYGTSFGVDIFEGSKNTLEKAKYFIKRIQKISVREKSAVDIMKNCFNAEAEWVLDPVFLCDSSHYKHMAQIGKIRLPKEKFIGAYILDPTLDKEVLINDMAKQQTKEKQLVILDAERDQMQVPTNTLNILEEAKVEEWLAVIKECHFFITDSFHGLCFALIFHRPFCVIFQNDNWRGISRIQLLLELVGLEDRLVSTAAEAQYKELWKKEINFSIVDKILEKEICRSKGWLDNALLGQKDFYGELTTFDILKENIAELKSELKQQRVESYRIRNDIFICNKKENFIINNQKGGEECMDVVVWGTGGCFIRNYERIIKFYNLKWACDSNPEKWGKELTEGVTCISPNELKKMTDSVIVIIMVDSITLSFDIANKLLRLGISRFDHFENWIKYVEQG